PRDAADVAVELESLGAVGEEWTTLTERITSAGTPRQSSGAPSQDGSALTLTEQRGVSVLLARARATLEAQTLPAPHTERCGGRLNVLADGSMMVTIWGPGSAVDRAERAARCALALQAHFAHAPIYVITGRGVVSARLVEGEVIDRAVRVVQSMSPGAIRIDNVTAGMLGPRFLTEPD